MKRASVGTIFVLLIFIGTAFIPSLGANEDNTMEKWVQDHTVKVTATTTCKYEQGYMIMKEVYTGKELKERFGVEHFTKELEIPVEAKMVRMEEGEEKVLVTEKFVVLTSESDPPHWWDYYEFPQWVWKDLGSDVFERMLPINLAWKNTTKDTAKSEILEEGWVNNPIQYTEYVYDPIDGWIIGDGVATDRFGIFGRWHANLWQLSDGNVVANAHHDTPVPHHGEQYESAEELVTGYFNELDDTEWRVYEDSYELDNCVGNVKSYGIKIESDEPIKAEHVRVGPSWGMGSDGAIETASTWYFPSGYSGDDDWIDILNPSDNIAHTNLTFYYENGDTQRLAINVSAHSRKGVKLNDYITGVKSYGIKIESGEPIKAVHVRIGPSWGMGSDGAIETASTWYFSSGYSGDDDWIDILNPSDNIAQIINITLYYEDGDTQSLFIAVPAHSRKSIKLNDYITGVKSYGIKIGSAAPVKVGHVRIGSSWGTGSDGTTETASTWYFSSGYSGDDDWIDILNPSDNVAHINLTFYYENGDTQRLSTNVSVHSRKGVKLNDYITGVKSYGIKVESNEPVKAAHVRVGSSWGMGSDGATEPASTWYFSSGYSGDDDWIDVLNPSDNVAHANLTLYHEDGDTQSLSITVPAHSKKGVKLNDYITGPYSNGLCTQIYYAPATWDVTLSSTTPEVIRPDEVKFGVVENATIWFDPWCDKKEEEVYVMPGIKAYFYCPNVSTPLLLLDESYIGTEDNLNWDLGISFNPGLCLINKTNVTITWNQEDVKDVPENYSLYLLDHENNITVNMREQSSYTFIYNVSHSTYNFSVTIEYPLITIFDTGSSKNPYPSIFGTHNGTITPNQTITVQKLYAYPCSGTGGHTEYARIWNKSGLDVNASWEGYVGDWHNISFSETFTLVANKTYNYTIKTGSYPQIHHTDALPTANGWINCTTFTDANGKRYKDWIPAIKLWSE